MAARTRCREDVDLRISMANICLSSRCIVKCLLTLPTVILHSHYPSSSGQKPFNEAPPRNGNHWIWLFPAYALHAEERNTMLHPQSTMLSAEAAAYKN